MCNLTDCCIFFVYAKHLNSSLYRKAEKTTTTTKKKKQKQKKIKKMQKQKKVTITTYSLPDYQIFKFHKH